jgi:hypothetical protein
MGLGGIISNLGGAAMDLFGPKAGKAERGQSLSFSGQAIGARGQAIGARGQAEASRYSATANRMRAGIYRDEATGYDSAGYLSELSLQFQEKSTAIQQMQADREIYKTIGGAEADIAGAGFSASGSGLDILRDSAAQGALTKEIIGVQGSIDANVYKQAALGYRMQAEASRGTAGIADVTAAGDEAAAGTYEEIAGTYDQQAGTYTELSKLALEMSADAKTKQKWSGVMKGIAGVADLGMMIATGGLSGLMPSPVTPGTSGG